MGLQGVDITESSIGEPYAARGVRRRPSEESSLEINNDGRDGPGEDTRDRKEPGVGASGRSGRYMVEGGLFRDDTHERERVGVPLLLPDLFLIRVRVMRGIQEGVILR